MKNIVEVVVDKDLINSIVSKSANPEFDHKAICRVCGTLYEFDDEDIEMVDGNPYPYLYCECCNNRILLNKKYRHFYTGKWTGSNNKRKNIKMEKNPFYKKKTKEEKERIKQIKKEKGIKDKTLPHSKTGKKNKKKK